MSFAPMVSRTRSRPRSLRCLRAHCDELGQLGDLGARDPGQAAPVPGDGHSLARWLSRKPLLTVAPEQPSGMKVTARWGFSTASASAVRIW